MSLRTSVTGTYTLDTIRTLSRPVAWAGTVDAATRRDQEADLAELVRDSLDAIDGTVVAVEIQAGKIVGLLTEVSQ
jgi:hypothetical protein